MVANLHTELPIMGTVIFSFRFFKFQTEGLISAVLKLSLCILPFYLKGNFVSATGATVMIKTDTKYYDESPVLFT